MDRDHYFATTTSNTDERARLAALEIANDPATQRHLLRLGVSTGAACLEVGAGNGSIANWMADRVGPSGRVVAADINTRLLDWLEPGPVEVRRLDILDENLELVDFDLVHCRFVLMHVHDPLAAVKQMRQALKPDGWILIEEPDFSTYRSADPEHPMADRFTKAVQNTFAEATKKGLFDSYFGLKTRLLLEQASLAHVAAEGTVRLWNGLEAEAEEHFRSVPALVRAGVCSESDAEVMMGALQDPTFTFVGHTVFAAWGQRTNE